MAEGSQDPRQAFIRLESHYRWFLIGALDVAIKSTPAQADQLQSRRLLESLTKALMNQGQAHMDFEFEQALPLARIHMPHAFYEALPRLTDEHGNKITPGELFSAIKNASVNLGPSAGSLLRLWIIAAQINEFYSKNPLYKRVSVNINPLDIDTPDFREGLQNILQSAQACGYKNIILEAVENDTWDQARINYLKSLQEYGATLAIDDYGAPEGFHNSQTLIDFSLDLSRPLIVKIDGAIIRNYIDKGDDMLIARLREIQACCPQAKVVAEWVSSAEEARTLLNRLNGHGLGGSIHMAQSRDLHETPEIFLQKIHPGFRPPAP